MDVSYTVGFFTNLLIQSPLYIVWLVGALVAVIRWRRHPRVSLLAVIGIGVLFANAALGTLLNSALPFVARNLRGIRTLATVLTVARVVASLVSAVGFGALLVAVFAERAPQPAVEKEG